MIQENDLVNDVEIQYVASTILESFSQTKQRGEWAVSKSSIAD